MRTSLFCATLAVVALASGMTVKGDTCADTLQNCDSYGRSVCSTYKQWAQQNCAAFCGLCQGGPQQVTPTCVDKIKNCGELGSSLCTAYVQFAQINCQKTCNMCRQLPSTGSACQDKLTNCPGYGKASCAGQYAGWAKDNCAKYCGLCQGSGVITGQTSVCVYKGQTYQEGQSWRDGCDKNCTCVSGQTGYYLCQSICPTYKNLPSNCQMLKQPGECCAKPKCPTQNVCVYKGKSYQQDQTWVDGCDYKCTCKDGSSGLYQCTSRCVKWNLVSSCHLNQPGPGKCCPTPNCPSNVKINYPPGYVAE